MEVSTIGSQMVKLGNFKNTMKMFYQIPEWKINGCTRSVVQHCISTSITSCGDRVQRTTRLLCETQWGYMIPTNSKNGHGMNIHFERLLNEYGTNEFIPVYLENDTPNFYLNQEVKSEETRSVRDAEHYFEKESQQSGNGYGRAVRL